jgi:membrane-bound lytic murein transglycosylase D
MMPARLPAPVLAAALSLGAVLLPAAAQEASLTGVVANASWAAPAATTTLPPQAAPVLPGPWHATAHERLPLPSGEDPPSMAPVPSDGPAGIPLTVEPPAAAPAAGDPTSDPASDPRADLWDRVRQGFALEDLDGPLVRRWEQWYATRPDYVQRMTERGSRYLFHIFEEVHRRGLPAELALLPFIESAFNPQAMSVARASGIWQFMPATGRDFDLQQNLFRDDRRSVLASTRAALDYLETLHRTFGDWHLALAAYNWGQGNVQRALERARRAGLAPQYLQLHMPDETRNYVPKLQAVKNIVQRPESFGLALPPLQNHPFFVAVEIDRDIDVELAARLADISLDDFHALNPQMNKPVVLAAGTPQLLLPYDNAEVFRQRLAAHPGPLARWTAWVAPRTLRVAEAARLTGMPEAQLRSVNRIPPGMMVRVGSTLLVPRAAHASGDVSEALADSARMALVPERQAVRQRTIQVSARGETLNQLARRHGVSAAQLARWNGLQASARLKPGQTLVMMAPAAPRAKAGSRAAPRPGRAPASARVKVADAQTGGSRR